MLTLKDILVTGKTLFMRVDVNVPLDGDLNITDDSRIRAILRRRGEPPIDESAAVIQIHGLTIDPGRRSVVTPDGQVQLTYTEFQVLYFLARRPGWVFTRSQIVDEVRGRDYAVTDRSVDVQIVGLRKKLGPRGKYIETVRGVGYRFKEIP